MLETSLLAALSANFLFMLPFYKRQTKSSYISVPVGEPRLDYQRYEKRRVKGFLEFKPFTCLFCMTFWLTLIATLCIPLFILHSVPASQLVPSFCAPVLAVIINKVFNALPTTI